MNKENVILASNSATNFCKLSTAGLLVFSAFTFSVLSNVAAASSAAHGGFSAHVQSKIQDKHTHKQQAKEQTLVLANRMAEFRRASKPNKKQLKQELMAYTQARQNLLIDLVKTDPSAAVRAVLPASARAGMPDDVLAMLTQKRELKGELQVLYVDYADSSKSHLRHSLMTENGAIELYPSKNSQVDALKSGTRIIAKGWMFTGNNLNDKDSSALVLNDELDSLVLLADTSVAITTAMTTTTVSESTLSNTTGEQRTLVLLVNFQNNTSQPWTVAQAQELVFGRVNDYYQEASYGRSWLSGEVQGYFTLPIDATCSTNAIDNYGRQAVIDSGIDAASYDRWIYIYPQNPDCGWTGQGTIGGSPSRAFINGSMTLRTVGHELGHNLGLHHAKDLDCGADIIGARCASAEYGDTMDIMGKSGITGHFNVFSKQQLGWITSSAGEVITAESDGSYQLEPYETAFAGKAKGLKVRRGIDADTGLPLWYYLEYRQPIGFDNFLEGKSGVTDGVVLHLATENDVQSNLLLDMIPNSGLRDLDDSALLAGASYTDVDAGVTITTEWADTTGASVNVSYSGLSCVKANPSLSLQPNESAWVVAGTAVTYSVSVINNDSLGCSTSDYDVSAFVPSGWSVTQTSLSLAPGVSGVVTLNVSSSDTAADGFYDIEIRSEDSSNSDYAQTGIVSYVVDSPVATCVMASPRLMLSVDSSGEVASGTVTTYRGTITSQDSSSCASSDFDITANVPAGWSVDTLGVSLAAGESRNISLNVMSSTVAQDGTYDFDLSAQNRLDNRYTGNAIASYTVSNPLPICTLAAPSIVVLNPQGAQVVAGTQVSYSATVTSQDSEACLEASVEVFADVPTGWSASNTKVNLAPGGSTEVNISVTSDVAAAEGSFSIAVNAQNTVEASYIGSDSVSYTVKSIANTAPVAVNDSVSMAAKTSVTIDVLGNDSDAQSDELVIVSVSQGAKGSVQITSTGQLLYTPGKRFKSSDSFSYTISDGDMTATASVSLSLSGSSGGNKGKGKK
ncbi:peptidase M11 [Shewanella sp. Choline-02u-19]|uniref:Ig-like domain-containing protein n=1 Tax=unclassified Shewanella TaxID=196818 RepID=UPI000C320579|nr:MULTISPECIES: Ig-like domain-containing protein [unclassified Shewanella]PKH56125.1 peptidase M11 [Shewanella sp. Bg11-22]PKI27280.1 peptidase M11 [Shewanella sp. Choline-02u-19]